MGYQKRISSPFHTYLNYFVILIFTLAFIVGCESKKVIVNNLDEKEANEILVYLSNKGIVATKVPAPTQGGGGAAAAPQWNISVDSGDASQAMFFLNQVGLPRRPEKSLLNIFANTGLVPSGIQDKVRYQAGLGEQIASIIRKIDGVLDANVQISFPEEDPLNPNASKQKATAAVYIKHNGVLDDPNAHLATRIKRLVAGSVNGLDYDNVSIIGDRARYADSPLTLSTAEEKPFVHIWSLVIGKESVTLFRIIFFSFIALFLIFLFLLIGLIWKFFPLIKEMGVKSLLNIRPLDLNNLRQTSSNTAASEEEEI